MRVPIIVGVVVVVVVVAAGILAPQFRSGDARVAEEARSEAILAQRLLYRYNYRLPQLERWAAAETLKVADLDKILEAVREDGAGEEPLTVRERLGELKQQDAARLAAMARAAREAGLPEPEAVALSADASGLQRAVSGYEQALRANEELLKQAQQHANAARAGAGGSVLGVAQIAGMVEYTRAAGLLAEAQVLRQRQQALQARLLRSASQWGVYRASADYQDGLDVTEILAQLREDVEEVRQLEAEGARAADELAAQVAQREQELAGVQEEMQQAGAELRGLESRGFTAGDDESFNAYRQEHVAVSQRLRELQEREELLRYGGRAGAELVGEDLISAKIEGGEVVEGLEKLRPRFEAAQEKAKRLSQAVSVLEGQIEFVEQAGRAAQEGAGHYAKLQDELDAEQNEIRPQVFELAQQAGQKENEALQAARNAVSAFHSSQQAADEWVREAGEIQREKDSERTNPRLRMMVGDQAIPQMGSSAEAAALMLIGRIYAQRIEANEALINEMNVFGELRPGSPFEPAEFEEQITTAREEAFQKLEEARKIYDRLVSKSPQARKWIPQAGLAAVHHLMARIDPGNAAAHLVDAVDAARLATEGREQSPYVKPHVLFREHLQAQAGSGAAQPPEGAPEDEEGSDEGE